MSEPTKAELEFLISETVEGDKLFVNPNDPDLREFLDKRLSLYRLALEALTRREQTCETCRWWRKRGLIGDGWCNSLSGDDGAVVTEKHESCSRYAAKEERPSWKHARSKAASCGKDYGAMTPEVGHRQHKRDILASRKGD